MGCGVITKLAEAKGITPGVNVLEDVSTNLHGAGVSAKIIPLKAGQKVVQHKHDYDHLSILLSGRVTVRTDDDTYLLNANEKPVSIVIKANVYHALQALTDATWLCIHPGEDYI